MVYLKSVENVITLGKLIGLLFLFCLPLLSILFLKTKRNDLARPVMGTIFLVISIKNSTENIEQMPTRFPFFELYVLGSSTFKQYYTFFLIILLLPLYN